MSGNTANGLDRFTRESEDRSGGIRAVIRSRLCIEDNVVGIYISLVTSWCPHRMYVHIQGEASLAKIH